MSREDQQKLGFQAMGEVYKQMPVLPDSNPMTQYVQKLGKRLVKQIPQQYTWPYEFHVIAQKEINAFALPGGPMFINVGTIAAAQNEAQLAGVMAHEMSHVYMQHSAKQIAKAQWTGLIAGLAGAVTGDSALGGLARASLHQKFIVESQGPETLRGIGCGFLPAFRIVPRQRCIWFFLGHVLWGLPQRQEPGKQPQVKSSTWKWQRTLISVSGAGGACHS
jgi:Zn-dependent protease with chaperone function